MTHRTPILRDSTLTYYVDHELQSIVVESPEWWEWLSAPYRTNFQFHGVKGTFVARRERRAGVFHWYAHTSQGVQHGRLYLGLCHELTLKRLNQAASECTHAQDNKGSYIQTRRHRAGSDDVGHSALVDVSQVGTHSEDVPHFFITTKLLVPTLRADLVPRGHLVAQVNQGVHHKVTLLLAPAGFGKTTLLCQWAHQHTQPLAWISLDEQDNEPFRFWTYVITAVQNIHPSIGHNALFMLRSLQSLAIHVVVTNFINDLTTLASSITIVLDDYHLIIDPAVHQAVEFFINHMPDSTRLIISSRNDLPLSLTRLQGQRQLTTLGADDFCLTADEADLFWDQSLARHIPPEIRQALLAYTRGWIVGLDLAARSLHKSPDPQRFLLTLEHGNPNIFEYLASEVFDQQPAQVRHFLLSTAVLDQLTGSLCEAVIGDTVPQSRMVAQSMNGDRLTTEVDVPHFKVGDGRALLQQLDRAHLFITPIDDQHYWYQYHHLFRTFLRNQLYDHCPDCVPLLHCRAADWYEKQGMIDQAVEHLLSARAWDEAARLVLQTAETMLPRGEVTMLLTWLSAIPEDVIRIKPDLSLVYAWALLGVGRVHEIERRLRDAAENHSNEIRTVSTHITISSNQSIQAEIIRLFIVALRNDMEYVITQSQHLLEALPDEYGLARHLLFGNLGYAYSARGMMRKAYDAFAIAAAIGQNIGNVYGTVLALSGLSYAQFVQGQLEQVRVTCYEQLQLATIHSGEPLPIAAAAYLMLGELHYEWNMLDEAAQTLTTGIALCHQLGNPDMIGWGYVHLARVHYAQGNRDNAYDMLEKAEHLARTHTLITRNVAKVAAMRAHAWLMLGEGARATRWLEHYTYLDRPQRTDVHEFETLVYARIRMQQGHFSEVSALLEDLQAHAEVAGRTQRVLTICILKALALHAQDQYDLALSALAHALTIAEPEGYVRSFVDSGSAMTELLIAAVEQNIVPVYARQILTACRRIVTDIPHAPSLDEQLNERELMILRLMSDGLLDKEIAHELALALNTVKWYAKSIYSKLDARNRTQAVARARILGILS